MNRMSMLSALALAATVACTAGAQSAERNGRPERPQGAQQDNMGRRGPRGPEGMLLRGITLSADQQTKLADLQNRERAAWDANRPQRQNGQDGATARPRRERGDTTGFGARRAEMERRFEQRIAAIREILTPDQRTQFDKNVAEAKANRPKGEGRFGGPRERGGFRGQGR